MYSLRLLYASDTFILRVSINLCLYDDVLPLTLAACFDHAPEIRAHIVVACHGAVDIGVYYKKIIVLGVIPADAKLSFN